MDQRGSGHDIRAGGQCAFPAEGSPPDMRRREVLAMLGLAPLTVLAPQAAAANARSTQLTAGVVRSALHVHTSFSEGASSLSSLASTRSTLASMESQVDALATVGADLCFFTDHDHLLWSDTPGLSPVPFPELEDLRAPHWAYRPETVGSPTGGTIALTSAGLDASVTAGSTGAWRLMFVDCMATQRDYRATMAGLTITLTLEPRSVTGWTEMRLWGSVRPAMNGRRAGTYEVHYRFTPAATVRSVRASDLAAIVTVPVSAAVSQQVTVSPVDDLRAAFPDLGDRAQDNGLYGIWLGVGAPAGAGARGILTSLALTHGLSGPEALAVQSRLMGSIAPRYPGVALGSGLELSYLTHLNWFSPDAGSLRCLRPAGGSGGAYLTNLVRTVHSQGGVASYNHPFGAPVGPALTGTALTRKLTTTAQTLLANGLYGADVLEVGYEMRGHVTVATHIDLWDILLSAGFRVMADGVSDDHAGTVRSWVGGTNHYFTDVISASNDPAAVVPLLALGRSFVSLGPAFRGMLDLSSDATLMGGTHTGSGTAVDVLVTAEGVPSGGTVRVVQVPVHGDRSRATVTPPRWQRTRPSTRFTHGPVGFTLANVASYVRSEVRDAAGTVVAFSNPLFIAP